jgi:hypothetical protein
LLRASTPLASHHDDYFRLGSATLTESSEILL